MAKFDVYKRQDLDELSASLDPPAPVLPNDIGGRARWLYSTITFEAADGAGDYNVAELPKDARILDAFFVLPAVLPAGNSKLGDSGDDDRYIAAVDTAATGKVGAIVGTTGLGYVLPAKTTLVFNTTANPAGGEVLSVAVQYVLD